MNFLDIKDINKYVDNEMKKYNSFGLKRLKKEREIFVNEHNGESSLSVYGKALLDAIDDTIFVKEKENI